MPNYDEYLKWFLTIILAILTLYIIVRLMSYGVIKSYFQAKENYLKSILKRRKKVCKEDQEKK